MNIILIKTQILLNLKEVNKYVVENSVDGNVYEGYTKYTEAKSYTIDELELGKTYYYKVRSYAINISDSKVYSSYSSIKSIKSN